MNLEPSQAIEPLTQHNVSTSIQLNSFNTPPQPQFEAQQMPPINRMETVLIPLAGQTVPETIKLQSSIKSKSNVY